MIKLDIKRFIRDHVWFGWMYLHGSQQWIRMNYRRGSIVKNVTDLHD